MAKRFEAYWNHGIKFLFAYDAVDPTVLHIYARHLTDPYIAMRVWWEGEEEIWNDRHRRYEITDNAYTLYWFWLKKDEEVLIISCFRR